MGHSDSVLAIGLNNKDVESEEKNVEVESIVEPVDVRSYMIPISELAGALEKALEISLKTHDEIKKSGWKVVHQSDIFSLFKRRLKRPGGGDGPVEYLMTGTLPDISPRTFLHSQIDKQCRKQWDKTMKDMSDGSTAIMETGGIESEDILYYRTKWPWPLKDRDYTLARRCKLFDDKNAIILVSRSTECLDHPSTDGVIRVDNYWCHSAILSTRPKGVPAQTQKHSVVVEEIPPSPDPIISASGSGRGTPSRAFSSVDTPSENFIVRSTTGINKRLKPKKFDPRARLDELKRNANMKGGAAFAAKIRSKAREAMAASRASLVSARTAYEMKKAEDKTVSEVQQVVEISTPKLSAVDLPGMSFITLFCDDQKVPLPSTIVDILSKQGEKVVPESISRLHEIAREVEDRKQQLLGTTVQAAMAPSADPQGEQILEQK